MIVRFADIFRDLATGRPEWLGILMSVRILVSSISVINKIMLSTKLKCSYNYLITLPTCFHMLISTHCKAFSVAIETNFIDSLV